MKQTPETLPDADALPGLAELRRDVRPERDLWPGIHARLKPRRAPLPLWTGGALAASLLLAVALPLRQVPMSVSAPAAALATPAYLPADYLHAQMKVVEGAEQELLRALQINPRSESLHRLLESSRAREHALRQQLQST